MAPSNIRTIIDWVNAEHVKQFKATRNLTTEYIEVKPIPLKAGFNYQTEEIKAYAGDIEPNDLMRLKDTVVVPMALSLLSSKLIGFELDQRFRRTFSDVRGADWQIIRFAGYSIAAIVANDILIVVVKVGHQ